MARAQSPGIRVRRLAIPLRGIGKQETPVTTVPETQPVNWREIEYNGLRWIDIEKPGQDNLAMLSEQFGFHELVLDDLLSRIQRPKLDDYDDYLFLVTHFPRFDPKEKVSVASEVDFFLGRDYVITGHSGDLLTLTGLFARLEEDDDLRTEYMGEGSEMLLYRIFDRLTNYLFPIMNKIDKNLDDLEERIFSSNTTNAVQTLARYRRDIISLRRIIRPNMLVISMLENGRASILNKEEMDQYWGDIADHFDRVWDNLGEFKEQVEGFNDTFNTLYSFRINDTLRALTIISVILLPLTLITGLFGMNVPYPHEHDPVSFWAILLGMFVIAVLMLVFFWRKRWL